MIEQLPEQPCKVGDLIELLAMPQDPDPIPVGTTGEVLSVTGFDMWHVAVAWDIHRSLSLCIPPDRIKVLPPDHFCRSQADGSCTSDDPRCMHNRARKT